MKTYKIIKTIIYILAGILILIFNHQALNHLSLVVGGAVLAYGFDGIIMCIIKKDYLGEKPLILASVNLLIGLAILLVKDEISTICIIWAVWSILREGVELTECLHKIAHKKPGFINMAESIVVIIFSFTMILNPTLHHAHTHIIILGIELILEIFFPQMDAFYAKYIAHTTHSN